MHTLVPWFCQPAPAFLMQLGDGAPVCEYPAGAVLLEGSKPITQYSLVDDGICLRTLKNGFVNAVGFIGAGASFGELACFMPDINHGDVVALTPVRVRNVECAHFLKQLELSGETALAFLRYATEKNNQIWKIITLLLNLNVRERFLYFINSCIAPLAAVQTQAYYPLVPDLNQTEIAEMLAVNRISLAKIIRPLREQGLVQTPKSSLLVHRDCLDELAFLRGSFFPPSVLS